MSKDRMLKKGDSVVMHTCGEATFPKYFGKIWTCKTDEFITGEGKGLYEQRLVFLEGFSGSFATDYLQYIDFELARSAPETTASPSETAADKGILTEEELNKIDHMYGFGPDATFSKVINSHRELFKANAELSFKNQKLNDDWLKVELERHEAETRFKKIKEDYDALVSIIDRARKLAFLTEELK